MQKWEKRRSWKHSSGSTNLTYKQHLLISPQNKLQTKTKTKTDSTINDNGIGRNLCIGVESRIDKS